MSSERTVRGNSVTISGLRPGVNHIAQLAAVEGSTVGPWGPALTFQTSKDDVAPKPPSDFKVESRVGSFIATWKAPTENEDGSPIEGPGGSNDFKDFVLTITDSNGLPRVRTVTTSDTSYELTFQQNAEIFGVPRPQLGFQIVSRDTSGNRSSAVFVQAVNPPPEA